MKKFTDFHAKVTIGTCIWRRFRVKYNQQSKIGSCKEVLRARAATITRRTLECFRPQEGLEHFLFTAP